MRLVGRVNHRRGIGWTQAASLRHDEIANRLYETDRKGLIAFVGNPEDPTASGPRYGIMGRAGLWGFIPRDGIALARPSKARRSGTAQCGSLFCVSRAREGTSSYLR